MSAGATWGGRGRCWTLKPSEGLLAFSCGADQSKGRTEANDFALPRADLSLSLLRFLFALCCKFFSSRKLVSVVLTSFPLAVLCRLPRHRRLPAQRESHPRSAPVKSDGFTLDMRGVSSLLEFSIEKEVPSDARFKPNPIPASRRALFSPAPTIVDWM